MRTKSWPATGPMFPDMEMYASADGTTSNLLMSFAAALPAKILVMPEPERASLAEPDPASGLSISALWANYDHPTSSWRMLQQSFIEAWIPFAGDWPRSAMMRNGSIYSRLPLAYLTNVPALCWLPTPTATNGAMFSIQRPITTTGRYYSIKSNAGVRGGASLHDIAQNVWGGRLNPQYVEAMMGFPLNWSARA